MTQTLRQPTRLLKTRRLTLDPTWTLFGVLSLMALWTFALPVLPAILATGLMLSWRTSWQDTAHPFLRALSFQAVALAGGVTMLALSPSCASGALLGLMVMNLLATVLSGRRTR